MMKWPFYLDNERQTLAHTDIISLLVPLSVSHKEFKCAALVAAASVGLLLPEQCLCSQDNEEGRKNVGKARGGGCCIANRGGK